VHLVRNSLRYVSYKDMKAVASDLKSIYKYICIEQAENTLMQLSEKLGAKYIAI